MYTVYVNDSPLRFGESPATEAPELTLRYNGKAKFLLQIIGTLEGGRNPEGAFVYADEPERLWQDFQRLYEIVPAAGGAVINDGRLLCIYRRGSWDLPKGKIDDGELQDAAALREVSEETGIQQLKLMRELPTTFHTYRSKKGIRVLKPTYWYEMQTLEENLIPQTTEDIERAEWVSLRSLAEVRSGMYPSLHVIVDSVSQH